MTLYKKLVEKLVLMWGEIKKNPPGLPDGVLGARYLTIAPLYLRIRFGLEENDNSS
jgi:hypothetical protein